MATFASGFVSSANILDNSITAAKMADNAIANAEVVSTAAIDFSKLATLTSGNLIVGSAANVPTSVTASGDVTLIASGAMAIGALKVTNAMLADDAVGLAEMAAGTAGNLITFDAAGNPAAVATGTAGQFLASNGAGAAPTFQAAGALVLKVAGTGTITTTTTTYDVNFTDVAFSAAELTAVDKIIIQLQSFANENDQSGNVRIDLEATTSNPTGTARLILNRLAVNRQFTTITLSQGLVNTSRMSVNHLVSQVAPAGFIEEIDSGDTALFTTAFTVRINTAHEASATANSTFRYWVYIEKGQ